jgi:hypothetical protein
MDIKITSDEEFGKLIQALAQEIVDANICHRLLVNLIDLIQDNKRLFKESNTFWNFVFISLDDARVLRLCKVYDQHKMSLNLHNLLLTIKSNLSLFEKDRFKERLKDNPFVEAMAVENRMPDEAELEEDLRFVSAKNPLVRTLLIWRNNIVSHIGTKVSLEITSKLKDNPLGKEEIYTLLDKGISILNKYSRLFDGRTYAIKAVGDDDYKILLKFANLGLEKWDADLEEEIRRIRERTE